MRGTVFLALVLLAGCTQAEPKVVWTHPELPAEEAASRGVVDSAECTAYAYEAIALPPPPNVTTQETNVVVQDNHNHQRNAAAYPYAGNPAPYQTHQTFTADPNLPFNIAEQANRNRLAALQEQQVRQQHQQVNAAIQARANLVDACMITRGWRKTLIETE